MATWLRTTDTTEVCELLNVETGAKVKIRSLHHLRLDSGPPYRVAYGDGGWFTGDNYLTGPQHDAVAAELMAATGGVNDGRKKA